MALTWKWRVIASIVIALVRLLRWRVDVRGLEQVERQDGAVLAFNHHSYFDFVMVAWAVVRELGRPVRFLAKREIWQSRWTGWIVRWGEAVPVDRGDRSSRHGAFAAAVAALRSGDLVAVAPEQTISRSFQLLPFRTGAVRMAQQAGVPIVPAIGWGTQRFATKGRGLHLAVGIPVTVHYGEPFEVGPDDDPVAATAELQQRMERLLEEVQTDYPDGPAPGESPWWLPASLGGSAPSHDEVIAAYERRTNRWRSGSEPHDDAGPDAGVPPAEDRAS